MYDAMTTTSTMVMMFFRCKDTLFSHENFVENLREYFRIVSAVSALFSQLNRFLDCEKTRKGDSYIICLMGTNDFVDLSGEGGNDVFGDIPHDIVVNSHIVVY